MTADLDPTPQQLRQQAKAGRREFAASPLSHFVRKGQEVVDDYMKARAQGVSREDGIAGIEAVLRDVWPGRTSKYAACAGCDNTGWHVKDCTQAMRCARQRCAHAEAEWTHTYAVACDCVLGEKYQRSGQARPAYSDEDLASVGKTKKRSGFTKFGR